MSLPTSAVPATGWSEFWGGANAYATAYGRSGTERELARALSKGGFRAGRALMRALNGAAAGATATATFKRVSNPAQFEANSGNVLIDTITDVNRATAAGDITYINAKVYDMVALMNPPIADYAVDLSGNGWTGNSQLGR